MSVEINKINLPMLDVLPNEVMANLNMVRLGMLNRGVGDLDRTFIVTEKRQFVTIDTVIL